MANPNEFLSALAKAYSLSRQSPEEDPDLSEVLERVLSGHKELGWLVVRVREDGFSAGAFEVPGVGWELEAFRETLESAGIQEIRFQSELEREVLLDFFSRLSAPPGLSDHPPSARFRGLESHMGLSFGRTDVDLPGMVGGIQRLFGPRAEVSPPPGTRGPPETSEPQETLEPSSAAGDVPTSHAPPRTPDPLPEVKAYLDSLEPDRREMEGRIRDLADGLSKARDIGGLTEMVRLLMDPGPGAPEDGEAMELGRELADPMVTSHLVARLGSTKDESERDRLTLLISRIGREGALALADALRESRDRSQRRVFMDAMRAMGPEGLERAQQMVEDPRWFVVRNGVALLGDLGGEDAVSYLTAALANRDPRVRKESVRSLAKVGGRDAEMLVMGMLSDGDSGVRAACCQALGILKSPRAVRALTDALKDGNTDVQVESLRALGQIGDPGVVRIIEKRATGRLFSRGRTEVRIAAFRALAGIGTLGALRILEKGAKDKDPAVRTVVRALLDTD